MPSHFHSSTLLAAIICGTLVSFMTATSAGELKSGQPFPDLVLPTLKNGEPASLSEFHGKKLILHIFASW
jgi:hypothetical protein